MIPASLSFQRTAHAELDDYMCKPMNRKGYLCKECIDGFAPSFTSPDYMSCSNCTKSSYYGVPIYILIELIPITFFYLLLLVLQVSVTSIPMTCYIFYSQIIMYIMVPSGRSFFLEYDGHLLRKYYNLVVIFAFYGVWNLDFLRYSLPKFCISPKVDQTQVTLLGFISVFYPLLLILLTWTLVTLHDRNVKVIVHFWRPFHKIFVTIRRKWDSRSDLIINNVFASFLLLSYSKLFYVVMNFTYTTVHIVNTTSEDAHASEVVQFINIDRGKSAAVFIILVGLLWGLTQLPVILLIFYPLKYFRKCLSKCKLNCVSINIFVEKFYGCYRDGLDGGRDMRSFAGFHFILRYLLLFSDIYTHLHTNLCYLHFPLFLSFSLFQP